MPVELQPLLRWRMARAHDEAWGGMRRVARERPELLKEVLEQVRERGPIAARELAEERPRPSGPWWDWSESKKAIELLFWSGEVTSARRQNFERFYDLPERVLPRAVLDTPTPSEEDAQRELVAIAARSLGVAALPELRDYFRLPAAAIRPRVAELVEAGELLPVEVEGWDRPALPRTGTPASRAASTPVRCSARSTTCCGSAAASSACSASASGSRSTCRSPSASTATTCCRSCSATGSSRASTSRPTARPGLLRAHAVHLEPGAPPETAEALRAELELLAGWLGLGYVP